MAADGGVNTTSVQNLEYRFDVLGNLKKRHEAGPIDWDVTTNSQGMEVGSYKLRIASRDATHVNLSVTLVPKTPWTRKSPDENIVRRC